MVNALTTGNTYINVHTQQYPAGEIRGQFLLATGSQTFTPPPAPPALPPGPPTQSDAARFLTQATFGPTLTDITNLTNGGNTALTDWLTNQFATPATQMYPTIYNRSTTAQNGTPYGDNYQDTLVTETWWKLALTAPDQLRHARGLRLKRNLCGLTGGRQCGRERGRSCDLSRYAGR